MGEYADYEFDRWVTRNYGFSPYGLTKETSNYRKRKSNLSTSTIVFVPGKIYWAKIVGQNSAVPNYEKTAKEWTYELEPDDISFLKEHRLLDRLKDKNATDGRGEYLFLKKPERNKDGELNTPIKIYDKDNNDWDDRLLGNGTRVVAKLKITDWGAGKKKSIWTQAIRVEELVPYEGKSGGAFSDYDGNDDTPAKPAAKAKTRKAAELDDLDDNIPF